MLIKTGCVFPRTVERAQELQLDEARCWKAASNSWQMSMPTTGILDVPQITQQRRCDRAMMSIDLFLDWQIVEPLPAATVPSDGDLIKSIKLACEEAVAIAVPKSSADASNTELLNDISGALAAESKRLGVTITPRIQGLRVHPDGTIQAQQLDMMASGISPELAAAAHPAFIRTMAGGGGAVHLA
jgi:hypothetical protein